MNFFIGANNAGKSIILGLLAEQLKQVKSGQNIKPLAGPDIHTARENGQFMLAVGRRTETMADAIITPHEGKYFRVQHGGYPSPTFRGEIEALLNRLTTLGQVWVVPNGHKPLEVYPSVDVNAAKGWLNEWQSVWSLLTGQGSGGHNHWIPETLSVVTQHVMPALPSIHLVPAKRAIGGKDQAFEDLSGKGLIDLLATLQQPNWDKQHDREKFQRINRFLQEVTGKPKATLEVPHGREHLLVHMDNKVLPLSSLGTGIHEVVLIAAFCTI